MLPTASHSFIVAGHAVDSLTGLGKDELLDAIVTGSTGEARGVIRFVSSHDGFFQDRQRAYLTRVVALSANGMSV